MPTSGPVRAAERIDFVDVLRGFAVFGILMVNMISFSGRSLNVGDYPGGIDRLVFLLVEFFGRAKFYSLFALLFGWGMAVIMRRAEAKGVRFVPLYVRRLVILLAIGIIHGTLIWSGDILTTYALLGLLLVFFRKSSPRTPVVFAVLSLLSALIIALPLAPIAQFRQWYAGLVDFVTWDLPREVYATGTYWEITQRRIGDFVRTQTAVPYYLGNIFSMFLLGLLLGRERLFEQIGRGERLDWVRRVFWIALPVGIAFNALFVQVIIWSGGGWLAWFPTAYGDFAYIFTRSLGAPAMMFAYVAGIILLLQRSYWRQRLAPLGGVGRTALSNYILQSLLGTLIFYSYGLGLYGEVGPTVGLLLTLLIFALQLRLTAWWLDRYRFGPLEWLWRSLTYGRLQPLQTGSVFATDAPESSQRPRWLAVALLLLLVIAALVAYRRWIAPPDDAPLEPARTATLLVTATPTSLPPDLTPSPTPAPTPIATPDVAPVDYRPGPLAAAGDWSALAQSFDAEEALARIAALSGPEFAGRRAGSPSGSAAGDAIAAAFASYGLQPAGDDGTFFQTFPIEPMTLSELPTLAVTAVDTTTHAYAPFDDFSVLAGGYMGSGSADGPVVWANQCDVGDFAAVDVVDKIALCRLADGEIIPDSRAALEHGAAGLLLLADAEAPMDTAVPLYAAWVPDDLALPTLAIAPRVVDDMLRGSGATAVDLALDYRAYPLDAAAQFSVNVAAACPAACLGRNVLGVLPGRDPAVDHEVIILGAHYDHMGQAPDGTLWGGANDNASGTATLLEIARTWHEMGYVPRRTVLFAAWDAEELGLLGSRHYSEFPRYPLGDTVATLHLDMVGTGSDTLEIAGDKGQGAQLSAIAAARGLATELSSIGRSDHEPFLNAGVPASLLIWQFDETTNAHYHRPADVAAAIEIDKLQAVGELAGTAVLGWAEVEPEIDDLLAQRAAAIAADDAAAFLATSAGPQTAADRGWFADLQAQTPLTTTLSARDVALLGDVAHATVDFDIARDGAAPVVASLPVRFTRDGTGWRWDGAALQPLPAEADSSIRVRYPPDVAPEPLAALAPLALAQYASAADLLGLPDVPDATLSLYSGPTALILDTAISLPGSTTSWVGPGDVRLVYSEEITHSERLPQAMAQLVLADAGVSSRGTDWLWDGLPPAIAAAGEPLSVQADLLPALRPALQLAELPVTEATGWAAVDYLRRRLGWDGLGAFVADMGARCRGACDLDDVDAALQVALGVDGATFAAAWQSDWRERLAAADTAVDTLLAAQADALASGSRAAYLRTIDRGVPLLLVEQGHWFDALQANPEPVTLAGQPLALFDGGRILAEITFGVGAGDARRNTTLQVVLTPDGRGGYRWAGAPLEQLEAVAADVLHPAGQTELAQAVATDAGAIASEIAVLFGDEAFTRPVLKLYAGEDALRLSIAPNLPRALAGWTAPGETIRLYAPPGATAADLRAALTEQLVRQRLFAAGVDAPWLLDGTAVYLAGRLGAPQAELAAQAGHAARADAALRDSLPTPDELALAALLPPEAAQRTLSQAWNIVRYLSETYGQDTFLRFVTRGEGIPLAHALTEWQTALATGGVPQAWVDTAVAFDTERALVHLDALTAPVLAGRQAGSTGAAAAADYIAAQFAAYGLQPIVPVSGTPALSYVQPLPIEFATLEVAPRLSITAADGTRTDLGFRQDFLAEVVESGGYGRAAGELVWVPGDYGELDLSGKIVVRDSAASAADEMRIAADHGAAGLILLRPNDFQSEKQIVAKPALPVSYTITSTLPTVALTQSGTDIFLDLTQQTPPSLSSAPPALPLEREAVVEVPLKLPTPGESANVLGYLPGADPALRDEFIIVGAHYDHVGDDPPAWLCDGQMSADLAHVEAEGCTAVPGLAYSGANDNASGVAVLLEIARLWQAAGYRPARSVLFAAWGAQEAGNIGSGRYVESPVVPLSQTFGVLQLDAVAGGSGFYIDAQGDLTDDASVLTALSTASALVESRLQTGRPSHASDATPFRSAGIPTALLTWTGASEDNWPDALADDVEPDRLGQSGRTAALALMQLAR